MASNRIRTMPTDELVQRVVVALVDVMVKRHQTEQDQRVAARLYRELQKRTAGPLVHADTCTCEECCYELDEPFQVHPAFDN